MFLNGVLLTRNAKDPVTYAEAVLGRACGPECFFACLFVSKKQLYEAPTQLGNQKVTTSTC